jgi:4-hydroxyphenylacetate 3-monooxygenase
MKPEDVIADPTRPFTGAEYLQSLRDGREVYIDGERVADVTTHPALRNSARSIARLYDALHDPKHHDLLTCPTDTGSGGYTHRFFRVPRSREDLRGAQAAIAEWSRMTYGPMAASSCPVPRSSQPPQRSPTTTSWARARRPPPRTWTCR